MKLNVNRKLLARSDRVKSTDIHPTETWMLVSLYNGNVHIWNYETQQLVKSFEVCENLPVRAAKFVPRKNWIVTGSDDMIVRVFNYNTLEKVHQFEAHSDYLRSIAIHPTQPFVITSSDDMMIKLWDWENKWQMKQTFEGHTHYVMQVVINPKDNNTFASASLDKTIKVWQFGSQTPNFTLEGHDKGVNCVDYYHGGDKPYLISGADDRLVKIWDYQNKTCVATLDGHAHNVSAVCFHPELPIIVTGSEDSTVRLWHSNTYRLETTLNYGLERVWCISALKGSNTVAIGYDDGAVTVKLGREEPAVSMDSTGKIVWAKHSDLLQANLKAVDKEIIDAAEDGERLNLTIKEGVVCEIYPQSLSHSPNNRFVAACGDGEYIVYTAQALRNKAFGACLDFVWSPDSSAFAVRESGTSIALFKNFKQVEKLRTDVVMNKLDGGVLLAAMSTNSLVFYDWDLSKVIRRIDIAAKRVFWSENGELVAIVCDDAFFVLRYNPDVVANVASASITEDGVESAFDVVCECRESINTACWVGDCLIFTTTNNRINYFVSGEVVTIGHSSQPLYILGYISKDNRVYLCDKDMNVVSYKLQLSVLEYQTAVMRRDFTSADRLLEDVPADQRTRVAQFLEKQGFKKQAFAVTRDPEHRFELALSLGDLEAAHNLVGQSPSQTKWKKLADAANRKGNFSLAAECLSQAEDLAGLLVLATATGSDELMSKLAEEATTASKSNVGFFAHFLRGDIDACLDLLIVSDRLMEAAFFAHTYCPRKIPSVLSMLRSESSDQQSSSRKRNIGDSLADPVQYGNLFPAYAENCEAEDRLREQLKISHPASNEEPVSLDRTRVDKVDTTNIADELLASEPEPAPSDVEEEQTLDDEEVKAEESSDDGN